jgi:hypothetical protein
MKNHIETIKKELQDSLARSAMGYLKTAVDLSMMGKFVKYTGDFRPQPVVGNFAIAIELMLKTFIFSKNPTLVYNLPVDLRIAFTSPDSVGTDFNWRPFDLPLRSFEYTAVEMGELIKTFYILRSDLKQEFQPFFELFSKCRNVSVHASLPSFQTYEVERTAYLALRLFDEISPIFGRHRRGISRASETILTKLDTERANRVQKKMAAAKVVAKKLKEGPTVKPTTGWDIYMTKCPVCGSGGILAGDSDIKGTSEEDASLNFLAESFKCHQCELELSDIKEMELAGMPTLYDRTDEIDDWVEYHSDQEPF